MKTEEIIASTVDDAVTQVNKHRRTHRNKWCALKVNLNGNTFLLKFYNCYLQRGYHHVEGERSTLNPTTYFSTSMDSSVADFKREVRLVFEY